MHICISPQTDVNYNVFGGTLNLAQLQLAQLPKTDNHASTPLVSFYSSDALPAAQPTASKQ